MAKAKKETTNDAPQHDDKDDKQSALGAVVWKAITLTSTVAATRLAATAANKGWKVVTGKPVPVRGDYDNEKTRDVIAFTALSGMIMAGTKVAAERKAAEYYRQSTGHLPKALEHTKLTRKEKKAHKKLEKARSKAEKGATKITT